MEPERHAMRLLEISDTLRSGALEHQIIDEAVAIADAIDERDLAYRGRLRLIAAGQLNGDTEGRLAAFDWCLATHLSDPQRFPARLDDLDLLWELASIPETIAASPDFGLDVIVESLSTLHTLLERNAEGLSALRHAELQVARLIASPTDLDHAKRAFAMTPLDRYSPCPACRQSETALALAEEGRYREAADVYDLLLEGEADCVHEPERALARSLSAYLAAAKPKNAARAHERGYELVRHNPRHLGLVALHIDYLRLTGETREALTLVDRHLPWLAADPLNGRAHFDFLLYAAAALDSAVDEGAGDTIVGSAGNLALQQFMASWLSDASAWPHTPDARHGDRLTAASLAPACWAAARTIAAAFDARNHTTRYADRLTAGVAPVHAHPAVRARIALAAERNDAGGLQASFASLARDAPASQVWLQLARERATVEDAQGACKAIRFAHQALDRESADLESLNYENLDHEGGDRVRLEHDSGVHEHLEHDGEDGESINHEGGNRLSRERHTLAAEASTLVPARLRRVRAALYALEITLALERNAVAEAETSAGLRADVLIEDERLDLAEVELQVGLPLFGGDPPATSGTLERALAAARKAHVEPEAEVSILNALATVRMKEGRSAEAVEFMLTAIKLCGPDPDNTDVHRPLILLAHAQVAENDFSGLAQTCNRLLRNTLDRATRANALLLRAAACHGLARLNSGVADADKALRLYLELGYSRGVIDACTRLALLLEELGVQIGVADAWRYAVGEAERIDRAETNAIRFRLARALITAGKGDEAAAELDTVLEATVRARGPASEISNVLYWLGHAQRLAENDELAYASWSVALGISAREGDERACVRLGLALGRLLLDDHDPSCLDVLDESVRRARELTEPWELVDALHLLGQAQCEFDDPAGLRTLDRAVTVAHENAFDIDDLVASVAESRAHALDALGRDREALDAARRAARLYERLGERSSAGLVRLFTARLLTGADRTVEALDEYQRSVELLAADGAAADVVSRERRALEAVES